MPTPACPPAACPTGCSLFASLEGAFVLVAGFCCPLREKKG